MQHTMDNKSIEIVNNVLDHRHEILVFMPGDEGVQIASNFWAGEFKCKNGNYPWLLDRETLRYAQSIRIRIELPVKITSAYRTPEYNAHIKGAKRSKHMVGLAIDIAIPPGLTSLKLAGLAYHLGVRRIGVANSFVHIDTAQGEAYWGYSDHLSVDLEAKIKVAAVKWQEA